MSDCVGWNLKNILSFLNNNEYKNFEETSQIKKTCSQAYNIFDKVMQ